MNKKKKGTLIGLAILAILVLSLVLLNIYIQNRIENRINGLLHSPSAYESLDIGFLGRNIELTGINYEQAGRRLSAGKIALEDISLWQFVFSNKIAIGLVKIVEPSLVVTTGFKKDSAEQKQRFKKSIAVEKLQVSNGDFRLRKKDSAGNEVYFRFPELAVTDIAVDSSTLKEKIPFNYSSYRINGDSIRVNMNPEHFIAAGDLNIDDGKVLIKDFRIIPYYDKTEFDKVVPFEKDRISLRVDSINLKDLSFEFRNDTLHLRNPLMTFTGGDLSIYRNRLLPDDRRSKKLYSELLRKMPFKLEFEKVEVQKSKIVYEEGTSRQGGPARIGFYEVEASITNLINTRLNRENFPRTRVEAGASFMNETPVNIEWSFSIPNTNNKFLFSGNSGRVPGRALNSFLIPAMGIKAEGALQSLSFTLTGTDETAVGDVRVVYDQFRIELLEDNSREEKEIISALANLLVDNDGQSGNNAVQNIEVTRDKKRSFWNFVWSGVKKGMMEALKQL